MSRNAKNDSANHDSNIFVNSLRALVLGVIISLIMAAALSIAAAKEVIPEDALRYAAAAIIFVGAFIGGIKAASLNKSKILFAGVLTGAEMFLIMYIPGVIIKGEFTIKDNLIFLAACIAGSIIGTVLYGLTRKNKR